MLIGYDDLQRKGIKFSRTHIWRLVKAGRFPKPFKFTPGGKNSWIEEEIDALIADLAARSPGAV